LSARLPAMLIPLALLAFAASVRADGVLVDKSEIRFVTKQMGVNFEGRFRKWRANVVFLPVASRLKGLSHAELHVRNLVLEGILSIQAGDNPRVVSEKLMSLVPPAERLSAEEAKPGLRLADAPAAGADAAEAAA